MMVFKKILAVLPLLLILQLGVLSLPNTTVWASDDEEGIIKQIQPAHSHEIKSYTTQKINVNKLRPDVEPQIAIEPTAPKINNIIAQTITLEKLEPNDIAQIKTTDDREYILGAEDKIKITVFGEEDLSGEYKIGGDGIIAMPLIGAINVGELSLRQAEKVIENKLRDGYLKKPSVSIEVQESRPFYIMGEIRRPGSYNYINGMSILQAVAISGGFTYRANTKSVDVIRGTATPSDPIKMTPKDSVRAGDIIYVRERFF